MALSDVPIEKCPHLEAMVVPVDHVSADHENLSTLELVPPREASPIESLPQPHPSIEVPKRLLAEENELLAIEYFWAVIVAEKFPPPAKMADILLENAQ